MFRKRKPEPQARQAAKAAVKLTAAEKREISRILETARGDGKVHSAQDTLPFRQMYPDDQISEERPEDTIAELVRGAFLETLDDELPHSLAVVVDSIDYPEDNETGQGYDGKAQVNVSITWSVTPRSRSSSARAPRTSPTSRRSCAPRSTASSAKKPSSTSTSR